MLLLDTTCLFKIYLSSNYRILEIFFVKFCQIMLRKGDFQKFFFNFLISKPAYTINTSYIFI